MGEFDVDLRWKQYMEDGRGLIVEYRQTGLCADT